MLDPEPQHGLWLANRIANRIVCLVCIGIDSEGRTLRRERRRASALPHATSNITWRRGYMINPERSHRPGTFGPIAGGIAAIVVYSSPTRLAPSPNPCWATLRHAANGTRKEVQKHPASEYDHPPRNGTGGKQPEAFVDLVELVGAADQAVEVDALVHGEVSEHAEVDRRPDRAVVGAR